MNPTTQNLDPAAVNLARAIKAVENPGGDPNQLGKSGEWGDYQYTKDTWDADNKLAGTNYPYGSATREQQNEVMYKKILSRKNQGMLPAQIASEHNSGKADAYKDPGYQGVNKHGVRYNTPQYVDSVMKTYDELKSGVQNPTITPTPSTAEDPTLGQELKGRFDQGGKAVSDAITGKINPLSGVLQTAGAVAGGVGDVINKGLELIPGVKSIEYAIGKGVGALTQTSVGQAVVKELKSFADAHPELAADLEAGVNIATAIPILRGLGAVKNIAMDSAANALKGIAEKGATKDLTEVLSRTVGGRSVIKDAPKSISAMVEERAIPNIENGHYTTQESFDKLGEKISHIEDNELQAALAKANPEVRNLHWSEDYDLPTLEDVRKSAIQEAKDSLSGTGNVDSAVSRVNKIFDENKAKYGDYPTLQQMTEMKRTVRKGVNFQSPQVEHDVEYMVGQAFQKAVEDGATKLKLGDVKAINQKMANLIKAQKALKFIDGRPVRLSMGGKIVKSLATEGGALVGGFLGKSLALPETASTFAAAHASRGLSTLPGRIVRGVREGILERTGKSAVKESILSRVKRIGTMGATTVAQKGSEK